jgi:formate hydrogenlyase transcriptional activator
VLEGPVCEDESERVLHLKPAGVAIPRAQKESEQKAKERAANSALAGVARRPEIPDRTEVGAILEAIVQGVEAEIGDRFFSSLVRHLATALGAQYAFVSEMSADRTRFRTLAVWGRGAFLANFEMPLRGTPCEAVLNGQMSYHPRHLQLLFPSDAGLVDWGAESYCGVPLLDCSGKVVGHLAILDDKAMPDGTRSLSILRIFAARAWAEIERNRVQSALREREQAYRDLYEEAPVAYVSVGTDGRIKKANQRAAELFGYSVGEMVGRLVFDLYADSPSGKPKAHGVFQRFLAGQEICAEELECRAADGTQVWISLSVRPIRGREGQVEASRSMLVDITVRKRAEAALRDSEARLSRIVDSAVDAIVTMDEEEHIVLFNAAAEKAFHCSAAEAIGRPFGRFLSEGFRRALTSYVGAFAQPGSARQYMCSEGLTALRTDGAEFPIEATISQVEVGGRNLFTLILRDIGERRRAELELGKLQLANVYLREEIQAEHNFKELVGDSPGLLAVLHKLERVALTDSTVLICGETGTGKELIARAIHDRSTRKARSLIKVNCSAISAGLVESELFGHVKGAFTGAIERRIGRFELADGGTIFLDEVGELPLESQVKLLRVLQEQEFEPVGTSRSLRVDVRVIAATNRDLAEAVKAGRFRSDLFYRLNVFPLEVPPLRDRRSDIPKLAMFFLERFSKKFGKRIDTVSQVTMDRLVGYGWPGNIRELQNIIERAVVLSHSSVLALSADLLPAEVSDVRVIPSGGAGDNAVANGGVSETSNTARPAAPSSTSLEEVESRHILDVLQKTRGLIEGPNGAARILKLNPSTLRGRMKKLGINRNGRQIPWAPPHTSAVPAKCDGSTRRGSATSWPTDTSSIQ